MSFGHRFKELRLEKNFKQQELADDFNSIYGYTFTKSSISQYENDKKMPETRALIDFAFYFSVSVDYLLGLSDNRDDDKPDKNVDLVSELIMACNSFFDDFSKDKISLDDRDKVFKLFSSLYSNSL